MTLSHPYSPPPPSPVHPAPPPRAGEGGRERWGGGSFSWKVTVLEEDGWGGARSAELPA